MISVLIITHGRLAAELLAAAETIAGPLPNFRALSLDWGEGLEQARSRIGAELEGLANQDGVLILTDMFGDTPTNAALGFLETNRIELVSGVNLPMLVRLGCSRSTPPDVEQTARWIESKGQRAIRRAHAIEGEPLPGTAASDD